MRGNRGSIVSFAPGGLASQAPPYSGGQEPWQRPEVKCVKSRGAWSPEVGWCAGGRALCIGTDHCCQTFVCCLAHRLWEVVVWHALRLARFAHSRVASACWESEAAIPEQRGEEPTEDSIVRPGQLFSMRFEVALVANTSTAAGRSRSTGLLPPQRQWISPLEPEGRTPPRGA